MPQKEESTNAKTYAEQKKLIKFKYKSIESYV